MKLQASFGQDCRTSAAIPVYGVCFTRENTETAGPSTSLKILWACQYITASIYDHVRK